jgi:ParB family chromosome partitioning protein
MSLKLSNVIEKAKQKGYGNDTHKLETPVEITKPWQQESVLYNNDKKTSQTTPTGSGVEVIQKIDPSQIDNWEFHDRPESEIGDIQALANDFIAVEQQQPCIVRPSPPGSEFKYELIIGERRWRAAKLADIHLKVIVKKNLSNADAALAQAAENDNRVGLSDFAKGMSYSKLINDNIIKQKDLIDRLCKSKQYISALLSFSKIPTVIIDSINDWSKVSARTSETICRLSKKSEQHIDAIITLSHGISSGKVGSNSLDKKITNILAPTENNIKDSEKVFSSNGRHMFTWRTDNNKLPSIHFPKQINSLFSEGKLDIDVITKEFVASLENKLNKL